MHLEALLLSQFYLDNTLNLIFISFCTLLALPPFQSLDHRALTVLSSVYLDQAMTGNTVSEDYYLVFISIPGHLFHILFLLLKNHNKILFSSNNYYVFMREP